jgi:hypothetical protein
MIGTARFSLFERNWKKKKTVERTSSRGFSRKKKTGSFRERLNVVRVVDNRPPQRDLDVVLYV